MTKPGKKQVIEKDQRQLRAGDQRKIRGFTLLEVIIAIFLITVGITTVLILITRTISQMSLSFSRLTASYLAQEGIEIVRNIRDTNWVENASWDDGLSPGDWKADYQTQALNENYDNEYLNIDGNGFYSYSASGTSTKFKRKIRIVQNDPDILEVTVLVEAAEKTEIYSFTVQEELHKWR